MLEKKKIEDFYPLIPERAFSWTMEEIGPPLRKFANNTAGRIFLKFAVFKPLGKASAIVAKSSGIARGRDPMGIVEGFMKRFFSGYYIEGRGEEASEGLKFALRLCPYGFCRPDEANLCQTVMNMEKEMVKGIGGELVIEETIPEGARYCRFLLKPSS